MTRHLFLYSFLMLTTSAAAERLSVGTPDIDPSFILPYESTLDLAREANDGSLIPDGYWTDKVTFVDRGDRRLMRREVAKFDTQGQRTMWRVHLVDAQTLAPVVTHHREGADQAVIQHLDFDNTKVVATVVTSPDQPVLHLSRDLEQAPYDLPIWATILMSLPFQAGYSADFPVVGQGLVLDWETATVEARETVTTPGGRNVDTWRISTAKRPWTAWVSREAPYIVKTLQNLPDGGRVVSFARQGDPQ